MRLKTRTVDAMRMVTTIGQGWQQRLTFAESAETRAVVGHAAERAAKSLGAPGQAGPAMTWAFNGVTYQVEHQPEQTADGDRWTTWLRGHKGTTEEHGFTFEQALGATQNAASVVFIDFEPGSTAAGEDAGPVADGARKPSKRKPLKLKGHDQAAVIAAVEQNLTLPDAAAELKCTEQQLKAYAEKAGIVLSKYQARRAGDELPAAPATPAAAKKTSKRGAKRGGK